MRITSKNSGKGRRLFEKDLDIGSRRRPLHCDFLRNLFGICVRRKAQTGNKSSD